MSNIESAKPQHHDARESVPLLQKGAYGAGTLTLNLLPGAWVSFHSS